MNPAAPRYHYTSCGLRNVYIKNADFERDGPNGRHLEIPGIQILHTFIAFGVILREYALSHLEFRFLRTELGFSHSDLASLLKTDVAKIHSFENGVESIPVDIDLQLRILVLRKLEERFDHFKQYGVSLIDPLDKARIFIDDLPGKVLRNATDREIEISHGGGGFYSINLD